MRNRGGENGGGRSGEEWGYVGRKETGKRKTGTARAGGEVYTAGTPVAPYPPPALCRWMGSRFWPLSYDTGWHLDPCALTSLWPPTF